MLNRRLIGANGESRAIAFLKERKFRIVERNYRTKVGEIDIIAERDGLVTFVEVKTRRSKSYGSPEEAIDKKKRKRIIKAAKYYLVSHNLYDEVDVRFDVLSLTKKNGVFQIEYFENAFRDEG
ncbi:MAG: YraN family protein [Candidatus Cloacimonas sp. 4484_209]|nr:MAG: YraN family protein [Candidatus Cloacimonas sp. 4484_209]